MEFKDLNEIDKRDVLDLTAILSARVGGFDNEIERTEEEMLDTTSSTVKEHWGNLLLSMLKEK